MRAPIRPTATKGGATTGLRGSARPCSRPRARAWLHGLVPRVRRRSFRARSEPDMLTLYRLLLHLYPPEFSREYGAEIVKLARDLVAAGRGRAASRLAVDAIRSIPREWFVVAR